MPTPVPYFNFYPLDYLSSPSVACMSILQEGMYLRLLCYQWQDGFIPNCDRKIRALTKTLGSNYDEEYQIFKELLDDVFPIGEDGLRRNKRMEADRINAYQLVEKNRNNGKKGGRPKAQFESKTETKKPKQNPPVSDRLAIVKRSQSDRKANIASDIYIKNTSSDEDVQKESFSSPPSPSSFLDEDPAVALLEQTFEKWGKTMLPGVANYMLPENNLGIRARIRQLREKCKYDDAQAENFVQKFIDSKPNLNTKSPLMLQLARWVERETPPTPDESGDDWLDIAKNLQSKRQA